MSEIEWTDASWNPVTGCTKVSAGCDNCYAEVMARRLGSMNRNPVLANNGYAAPPHHFDVTLHPDRLLQPLTWKKPRRVFVCSMGDLFHRNVSPDFIMQVWAVMAACPQHTFQIPTKRPDIMELFTSYIYSKGEQAIVRRKVARCWLYEAGKEILTCLISNEFQLGKPLPNVHLGTSIENQQTADERIPHLLNCPAEVRFVSVEPMLGAVDLIAALDIVIDVGGEIETPAVDPAAYLHWVICGGESGPNARPMHPDWARGLRDQCKAATVPFFFKQWGAWQPWMDWDTYLDSETFEGNALRREWRNKCLVYSKGELVWIASTAQPEPPTHDNKPCIWLDHPDDAWLMQCVGKKKAGRWLDGKLHDEYPEEGTQ